MESCELSELIGFIYQAPLTGDWQTPMQRLMAITQSSKMFFFLQNLQEDTPLLLHLTTNFDYDPKALLEYQKRPLEDPFYLALRDKQEGDTYILNDYVDISLHVNTEYFESIYRPMRSYYAIGGVLFRDGEYEGVLAINRWKDEGAYTQEDLALMKMLAPHFRRALTIYRDLALYKGYVSMAQSIMQQSDKAIWVCDMHARVLMLNDAARNKLLEGSAVKASSQVLELVEPLINCKLQQYITQSANLAYCNINTQETLLINDNDNEYLMTVSPIANSANVSELTEPCCLITLSCRTAMPWPLVQKEMQLTVRETELLKAIHNKKTLNDLIQPFGVSYNTLRTHLQNIFKKFGVNSQTELMVKLSLFR